MKDFWDESASIPFWGKEEQLIKLSKLVSHCIETVTKSDSLREMVLETWLILDYAVRDLLVSGYGVYKFCREDFDLRYILLPQSFERLLKLLQETISYQSELSQQPNPSHDYPPYIHSSYGFLKHLAQNHKDIAERLKTIESEYFEILHPELAEQIKQGCHFYHKPSEEGIEGLPIGWTKVASNLQKVWFQRARELNKARNKAAHSYDAFAIAKVLGVNGQQPANKVRNKCLRLLKDLLGITLEMTSSLEK